LNAADHVPVSEDGDGSPSTNCIVPSPESGSLMEPDQVPAGDLSDVDPWDDVAPGEMGEEPPPQAETLRITASAATRRKAICLPLAKPVQASCRFMSSWFGWA
jgi:hypothetical protein